MKFFTSLRSLLTKRWSKKRTPQNRKAWSRPLLEVLEDRVLFATDLLWIGGHGPNWDTPQNWAIGTKPTPMIPTAGATLEFTGLSILTGLKSTDDMLNLGKVTLKLDATLDNKFTITLAKGVDLKVQGGEMDKGTIGGPGSFTIIAGAMFTFKSGIIGGDPGSQLIVSDKARLVVAAAFDPNDATTPVLDNRVLVISKPTALPAAANATPAAQAAFLNSFQVTLQSGNLKLSGGSEIVNAGSVLITAANGSLETTTPGNQFVNQPGSKLRVQLTQGTTYACYAAMTASSGIDIPVGGFALAGGGTLGGAINLGFGPTDTSQNASISCNMPINSKSDYYYVWTQSVSFNGGGIVKIAGVKPNGQPRLDAIVTVEGNVAFQGNVILDGYGGALHGPGTVVIRNQANLDGVVLSGTSVEGYGVLLGYGGISLEVAQGGNVAFAPYKRENQGILIPTMKDGASLIIDAGGTVNLDGRTTPFTYSLFANPSISVWGNLFLYGAVNIRLCPK